MTSQAYSAKEYLDNVVIGLRALLMHNPEVTITIELPRADAGELLYLICKSFDDLQLYGAPTHISLGTLFQYQGISFRIVERAK